MKNRSILKYISFGLLGLTILTLIAATILEKLYGSVFAAEYIYTAPYTIALWGLLAIFGISYLVTTCSLKQVVTIGIHLSFVLILGGALVTHICGRQGWVHLRTDLEEPVRQFMTKDGTAGEFPFGLTLKDFRLEHYPGTSAPMDYISTIGISDGESTQEAVISMNNIHKYKGYRFYQSGFDRDGQGTTLAVSYDPWGIGLTYTGYLCLLFSMAGFFFQKGSRFRSLLHHPSLKNGMTAVLAAVCIFGTPVLTEAKDIDNAPRTLSAEAAEAFGNLYVYYNDRICPMQTLAKDFTAKIYGKTSYKGLTAEQVLTGWFFYYDSWKQEPMIKIKGADAKEILDIEGKYARLTDFAGRNGYKLEDALLNADGDNIRNILAANEKFSLISMVSTGSMLRIYPFASDGKDPTWYSFADRLPAEMSYEEWAFVSGSMNLVAESIASGDESQATALLGKIREYQMKKCPDAIPSEAMFKAEKFYNTVNWNRPLAMLCMTLGIIAFLATVLARGGKRWASRIFGSVMTLVIAAVFAYLTIHITLRWYISGHIPLSNGFETMQFMAWCCLLLGLIMRKRVTFARTSGILVCGFALLVSMMGEANPRITQLMPVLQSPLLSIHVMVIMIAYTLFAFMMLNGIAAVFLNIKGRILRHREEAEETIIYLKTVSNILLYPAVFLLTAGIFIGAVWANVSWGRYWGWDPKEVWALITMLVYSFGMHQSSLKWLSKPMNFHIFCITAFLCVLMTYFGVNFILGGLHSYA